MNNLGLKLKDMYLTSFSILLVVLIFFVQCILLYNLYVLNTDSLQKQLNYSFREIYEIDLDRRLRTSTDGDTSFIHARNDRMKTNLDLIQDELYRVTGNKESNITSAIDLAAEEYLSQLSFINLDKLDSIAHLVLVKNNVDFNFYSEIINPKTDEIIGSTMPRSMQFLDTMESEKIPLNGANSEALRLVLINPMNHFYWQVFIMLISSLILSVVLGFSFYYHRQVLARHKKLVDFKNDLFADISHEMKRPLSVMSLVLSSFEKESILADEEKRTSFLRMAKAELDRMSSQTEMVLSLAKYDEGIFDFKRTEFDLLEMVSDLADKYTYISEKELNVEIIDEMDKTLICADSEHIEHILTNLMTNSIKYSEAPVFITIKLFEEKKNACISVKDRGVGLTVEQQRHVFDRYYRAGTMTNAKGHGIGLNYVKSVVDSYKGSIELFSEPNVGSEFIVKLPILDR